MIVASYYTEETGYEAEAAKLKASVAALGLKADIRGIPCRGSWLANCAYKPTFILERMREHGEAVLWLDADAIVRREPELLYDTNCDIAYHLVDGVELGSGTLYFAHNAQVEQLLADWAEEGCRRPEVWDQKTLQGLVAGAGRWAGRLATLLLPASYLRIFDRPGMEGVEPVIEHFQASRRLKGTVSDG